MTHLTFVCVILFLMAMLCGANYYLARRIYFCAQSFFPKLRLVFIIIALGILTVFMLLSVMRPFNGMPQRIISTVGALWMGMFVYLLLYFGITDLICLAVKLIPSVPQKLQLFTRLGAIALAVVTVTCGYIHANKIQLKSYHTRLCDEPTEQMRIVMVSDLHIGAVHSEERLKSIVAAINKQNPDIVCIAGDLFDNSYSSIIDPDEVIDTLSQISAKYGVYACLGNHDSGTDFDKMLALLERSNVTVLMDSYVVIDGSITLAGRLDSSPIGGYNGNDRKAPEHCLAEADPQLPVIMLDHNPACIAEYQGEVDLVLSGHTHKGQIFPGGLITGSMYTVDYGHYRSDSGTQIIVTSGAGTWGLPIRVGTDCEIVSIDLEY